MKQLVMQKTEIVTVLLVLEPYLEKSPSCRKVYDNIVLQTGVEL
jgi:hypothetical protein